MDLLTLTHCSSILQCHQSHQVHHKDRHLTLGTNHLYIPSNCPHSDCTNLRPLGNWCTLDPNNTFPAQMEGVAALVRAQVVLGAQVAPAVLALVPALGPDCCLM
jgi:hypothetical protein